jgi:hypothetical protein
LAEKAAGVVQQDIYTALAVQQAASQDADLG